MGLELAMQGGWKLPDVILYPTGGEPVWWACGKPLPNWGHWDGWKAISSRASMLAKATAALPFAGPLTPEHNMPKPSMRQPQGPAA